MLKFIHAADIHLDSPLLRLGQYDDAPTDLLRTATRLAVERLVDLAISERVAFLAIAGDLYDGDWDDIRTGFFMVKQFGRLKTAGIPVYVIAGNHDAASKMTKRIPFPDNVRFLNHRRPETVKLDSLRVAIHGQGFGSQAVPENLAANYPAAIPGYFNLGLLHTSLDGREHHDPYAPCGLDDLRAKGYDYWALGHIHQREVLCERPFIAFSGNLQGRNVRETGAKGCLLVTVDDKELRAEFRPLDVVRWERLVCDVSTIRSAAAAADRVRELLVKLRSEHAPTPLAVRVELEGASPCHEELMARPAKWEAEIRALAIDAGGGEIWLEKIKLLTRPARRAPSGGPAAVNGAATTSGAEALNGADAANDADPEGPLASVQRIVAEALADDETLDSLKQELEPLFLKLPPDLREGPDAPFGSLRDFVRSLLSGVEPDIRYRLEGRVEGGSR
jgi:DNA repair exonuclease SbcCD nuclease subunit